MLKIPDDLALNFDKFLFSKTILKKDQYFYKKWLRFYWVFCHKYHHEAFHVGSLPLFFRKLQEERQSEQQQNRAKNTVFLLYEMQSDSMQPLIRNKSVSNQPQQSVYRKKAPLNNRGNGLNL